MSWNGEGPNVLFVPSIAFDYMNWEALTAISTAVTAGVILLTVILGRRQLEQLRRATQLEGVTAIFAEPDGPLQIRARRFVLHELQDRMKDPVYRREVELVGEIDEEAHQELIVLRFFERIGMYVNQGLVDGAVIYTAAPGRIVNTWRQLHEVVEIHRRTRGPAIWQNFERLCNDTRRWQKQHGFYPRPMDEASSQATSPGGDEIRRRAP